MAYDTTEAVAKFLSGFQMKITNRKRDTVAPDYYVKYSLTLSKGGKDFSTTFVSDPRASGEPTVTQVFSALADDALTLRKYSADEFVDKLYAQGVKPSAALRAYDSCKETNLWIQDNDDIAGRVNPCAMSVETVRAVNEKDTTRCSPSSGRPSFLSAISTRKRFPLTAKRTIWKTAGMGLMVTPRKRMPRKRTIEMRSRL